MLNIMKFTQITTIQVVALSLLLLIFGQSASAATTRSCSGDVSLQLNVSDLPDQVNRNFKVTSSGTVSLLEQIFGEDAIWESRSRASRDLKRCTSLWSQLGTISPASISECNVDDTDNDFAGQVRESLVEQVAPLCHAITPSKGEGHFVYVNLNLEVSGQTRRAGLFGLFGSEIGCVSDFEEQEFTLSQSLNEICESIDAQRPSVTVTTNDAMAQIVDVGFELPNGTLSQDEMFVVDGSSLKISSRYIATKGQNVLPERIFQHLEIRNQDGTLLDSIPGQPQRLFQLVDTPDGGLVITDTPLPVSSDAYLNSDGRPLGIVDTYIPRSLVNSDYSYTFEWEVKDVLGDGMGTVDVDSLSDMIGSRSFYLNIDSDSAIGQVGNHVGGGWLINPALSDPADSSFYCNNDEVLSGIETRTDAVNTTDVRQVRFQCTKFDSGRVEYVRYQDQQPVSGFDTPSWFPETSTGLTRTALQNCNQSNSLLATPQAITALELFQLNNPIGAVCADLFEHPAHSGVGTSSCPADTYGIGVNIAYDYTSGSAQIKDLELICDTITSGWIADIENPGRGLDHIELPPTHHTDPQCDSTDSSNACLANVAYRKLLATATASEGFEHAHAWGNDGSWQTHPVSTTPTTAQSAKSYALIEQGSTWMIDFKRYYDLTGLHLVLDSSSPSKSVSIDLLDTNSTVLQTINYGATELGDGFEVFQLTEGSVPARYAHIKPIAGSGALHLSEFEAFVSDPFICHREPGTDCPDNDLFIGTLGDLLSAVEKYWGGDIDLFESVDYLKGSGSSFDLAISDLKLNAASSDNIDIDFSLAGNTANLSTVQTSFGYDLLLIVNPSSLLLLNGVSSLPSSLTSARIIIPLNQARVNVATEGPALFEGLSTPSVKISELNTGAKMALFGTTAALRTDFATDNTHIGLQSGLNFFSLWDAAAVTGSRKPVLLLGGVNDSSLSNSLDLVSKLSTSSAYFEAQVPFKNTVFEYIGTTNTSANARWEMNSSGTVVNFDFPWDQSILGSSGSPMKMHAELSYKLEPTQSVPTWNEPTTLTAGLRAPWEKPFGVDSLTINSLTTQFDFGDEGTIVGLTSGGAITVKGSGTPVTTHNYSAALTGDFPNGLNGDNGSVSLDLYHSSVARQMTIESDEFESRVNAITGSGNILPDFISRVSEYGFNVSYSYGGNSSTSFVAYGNSEVCSKPTPDGAQPGGKLVTFAAVNASNTCENGESKTTLKFSVGGNLTGSSLDDIWFEASADYIAAARGILVSDDLNLVTDTNGFTIDHARVVVRGSATLSSGSVTSWAFNAQVIGEWSKSQTSSTNAVTTQSVEFGLSFGLGSPLAKASANASLNASFRYASDIADCASLNALLSDYQANDAPDTGVTMPDQSVAEQLDCVNTGGFPSGLTIKEVALEIVISKAAGQPPIWGIALLGEMSYDTSGDMDKLNIITTTGLEGILDISNKGLVAGFNYTSSLSALAPGMETGITDGVVREFRDYTTAWTVILSTYDVSQAESSLLQQFYSDAGIVNVDSLGLNGAGVALIAHSEVPQSIVDRLHFLGLEDNLTTDLLLVYDNSENMLRLAMELQTRNCEAKINRGLGSCPSFLQDDSEINQYPHWFNNAELKIEALVKFAGAMSTVDLGMGGRLGIQLSENVENDETTVGAITELDTHDEILNLDITSDLHLNVGDLSKTSIVLCGQVSSAEADPNNFTDLEIATSIQACGASPMGGTYFEMLNIKRAQFRDLHVGIEITKTKLEVSAGGSIRVERGINDATTNMEYIESSSTLGFSVPTADPFVPTGVHVSFSITCMDSLTTCLLSKDNLMKLFDHHREIDHDDSSDPYKRYPDFALVPAISTGNINFELSLGNISSGNSFSMGSGFAFGSNGKDGVSLTQGNYGAYYLGEINMHFDRHELRFHGELLPARLFDSARNFFSDTDTEEFTFVLNNQGLVAEFGLALPTLPLPKCKIATTNDCHFVANGSFEWQVDDNINRWFGTGPRVRVTMSKVANMVITDLPSDFDTQFESWLEWDHQNDQPLFTDSSNNTVTDDGDMQALNRPANHDKSNTFHEYYVDTYVDSFVDFDGDGTTDLVQQGFVSSPSSTAVVAGTGAFQVTRLKDDHSGSEVLYDNSSNTQVQRITQFGDLNGDGATDILYATEEQLSESEFTVKFGGNADSVAMYSPDSFSLYFPLLDHFSGALDISRLRVLDVMPALGDEIVLVVNDNLVVCTKVVVEASEEDDSTCTIINSFSSGAAVTVFGIDVDGDGQESIVTQTSNGSTIHHFDGAWASDTFTSPVDGLNFGQNMNVVVGDFDLIADGKAADEVLYFVKGPLLASVTGSSPPETVTQKTFAWMLAKCTALGINGNCASWSTDQVREPSTLHPATLRFGDYDGDGEIDVLTTGFGNSEQTGFRVSYSAVSDFSPIAVDAIGGSYFLPTSSQSSGSIF